MHVVQKTSQLPFNQRTTSPYFGYSVPEDAIGTSIRAIHFRGLSIRQGSFNTLIIGYLLLGAPTCCLNTKTPFMVSLIDVLAP